MSTSGAKLRVVLDTHLAVTAEISRTSNPAEVIRAWFAGRLAVVTSQALLAEVEQVLSRPRLRDRYHFSAERVAALLDAMMAGIESALPIPELPVHCRDPNDD